ncbi:MAG: 2TM domain-containing protein, partial [Synechococcales bacterium]|nr:2TM domain-containing protein [Synechococcales bacterium]
HLAIARQATSEELSRVQRRDIAEELGLSPTDIQRAETEWLALREDQQERRVFIRQRRCQFRQRAIQYLIVNGFLMLFDFLTFGDGTHTLSFSLYIALIWGMFLTLDGWNSLQTEGLSFERKFQKWRRGRQFRRSVKTAINRWLKVL